MTVTMLLFFLPILFLFPPPVSSQTPPPPPADVPIGPVCLTNRTLYPCQSYAFYRAAAPDYLDLASISDLFGTSRILIAWASNISNISTPLYSGQPILVPLTCSCSPPAGNRSYALVPYQIKSGNTFYLVSTGPFQNLTDYHDVVEVNPTLVATNLDVGVISLFPIFCRCPTHTQLSNTSAPGAAAVTDNSIITYISQPLDTFSSIASAFGSNLTLLESLNGGGGGRNLKPFSTVFVPVPKVPISLAAFYQGRRPNTTVASPPPSTVTVRKGRGDGVVVGLGVAVGILAGILLALALFMWRKERRGKEEDGKVVSRRKMGVDYSAAAAGAVSVSDDSLMADIYDCLDKYRVYQIDELRRATSNFNPPCIIQGSVYKGWLNGEAYAIKRMKWNAGQELKILQKVNHTNLVKLEGFCIDPEDGTCYLVYEYVENGSLDSWLHDSTKSSRLDWRMRLKIALDLANGLQYIHEHTWPTVVHKDIRSSNVLLDGKMRAKIANFGLARSGCNAMTTNIVGTQGYVAPEYLLDGLVTTKMDVFAYGVVLLELVSGKEAVNEDGKVLWAEVDRVFQAREMVGDGRLKAWMDRALVEQGCPMESVASVMAIARACLQRDPSKRPSMVDIVYTLSKADDLYADFSGDGPDSCKTDVVAR